MNKLKEVYIFIGPPGSGKGSLSNLCVAHLGWRKLSTGNLCRKHIVEQTEIGKQIDFALKSGKLVSDDLITNLVDEWFEEISTQASAVILDGYPRTLAQAKSLHMYASKKLTSLKTKIVKFFVDDEVVLARLNDRYTCTNKDCQAVYSLTKKSSLAPKRSGVCDYCSFALGKRADDETRTIQERLVVYHKHEKDLLLFYKSQGYSLLEFNVNKNLDAVFSDFRQLTNFE